MKTVRIREKIKKLLGDRQRNTAEILEHLNSTMRHGTMLQSLHQHGSSTCTHLRMLVDNEGEHVWPDGAADSAVERDPKTERHRGDGRGDGT